MVIDMNEARLDTIEQIREFLAGTADMTFTVPSEEAKLREFVATVLRRFRYFGLAKGHRGVLFAYMQRLTGYSRQHLSRLVAQYRDTKSLRLRDRASPTSFARKYTALDVALLAELDSLHDTLSGPATKVLARRAYRQFGDLRYARLHEISVSHLYNLRAGESYRQTTPGLAENPALADHHRRPQSARATGSARLHPYRHRAPGRSGRRQGRLSHQCGRYRDPMAALRLG
jgi:hypothetical protein